MQILLDLIILILLFFNALLWKNQTEINKLQMEINEGVGKFINSYVKFIEELIKK